ncbi:MAG TPA: arylamine N-acetyltransferase [Solirubrobacteraceae bacterium]|nr:arylamine N-acetyltransferase [Solirubrobacteraceae bacterium]
MLDFESYLRRIGLTGARSIAELHRAHASSIPFENLDPHRGELVSLAPEDIERKLVQQQRGGYCFEQNLLLKAALEEMGAEVDTYLARVRWRADGAVRPRSHLVLRARLDGEDWHADVGFGVGTPLEPLPWGPGEEHEQSGWRFRIVWQEPELLLQTLDGDRWADLYGLQPLPSPAVDLETSNWFVSTHPDSPFVNGLIVASRDGTGRRVSLCDWSGALLLAEQTPAGPESSVAVERERIPRLLSERFGLEGFGLDGDGRVVVGA